MIIREIEDADLARLEAEGYKVLSVCLTGGGAVWGVDVALTDGDLAGFFEDPDGFFIRCIKPMLAALCRPYRTTTEEASA